MKTIILGLGMVLCMLTFTGCEKEKDTIANGCNCGKVVEHEFLTTEDNTYFWVEIQNNCSDSITTFVLDELEWSKTHINNSMCLSKEW